MATAGSIVVDLLMRTGSFETDSKRAEQRMKQMERQINRSVRNIAMAGVAVAGTFAAAMKSASSYMSEIGYAAQRTSVSAQAFSELAYAAGQANLSQGELERVLRRSTEAINHGAAGTGKQAAALQELGISAYDASGQLKTADVMLRDMIDKFSKLEPGAKRTGLVLDLFGQQLGQKVIPLLNGGSDGLDEMTQRARDFGIVIDDEAAQAAMDFESNLADLRRIAQGLAVTLMQDLLPSLNSTITGFINATRESSLLMSAMAGIDRRVGQAWDNFWEIEHGPMRLFETQARLIKQIEEQEEAIRNTDGAFEWIHQKGLKAAKARLEYVNAEIAALEQVDNWARSGGTLTPIVVTPSTEDEDPPKRTRTRSQVDAGQRLIDQMNERIALLGKETEYEKLLARISVDAITFRTEAQVQEALAQAQTLDFLDEQMRAFEESQQYAQEFAQLMENLFPERAAADQFISQMGMLNHALEEGWINAEMFAEAVVKLEDQFAESTNEMNEFAVQAARNIQTHLGDGLYDMVTGKFDGIGDRFADMLLRMATDAAAANIAGMLFGDYGSSGKIGGLLGSVVSGLTGSLGGGAGSSYAPAHGFSDGGYTGPGGKYDAAGIVHKGEYVFSKEATQRLGVNRLERLHKGYASGGPVGGASGSPAWMTPPKITINNTGSPQDYAVESITHDEVVLIARDQVARETPKIMAREQSDPNSRFSRQQMKNLKTTRQR